MGAFEELKGKAKSAIGDMTDNSELRREGEAQQDKGYEERKESEAKAKAQAHEQKAKAAEKEQELAERSA